MKKLLCTLLLMFSLSSFSQNEYSDVLDLLINNQREEARKLFDKKFSDKLKSDIDLLFLDVLIDVEFGKTSFDETLLKNIEMLPNSEFYIDPFINENYILSNVIEENYDDLVFKKIDFLAQSEKFKNRNIVKYRKGVLDVKRLNFDSGKQWYKSLGTIDKWQYCGVFENLNSSGLNTEYGPETIANASTTFDANSNGEIGWYIPKETSYEGYQFFLNEKEYGEGIIYAQVFVNVPEDKRYLLQFGTSSGIKVFIDDVEVATKYETGTTNLDAFNYELDLKKGTHRLLLKVETKNGSDYFSCSLKNTDGGNADELEFSEKGMEYTVGNFDPNTVEEKLLDFETFFENKVKKEPTNVLYKLFLFSAYTANKKKEKAFDAIEGLDQKFPKSSLISKYFITYYLLNEDNQKVEELQKNIENNDKDYSYTTILKIGDTNWLKSATISDLEEYYIKSKKYPEKYYSLLFQFMIQSRKSDIEGMISTMKDILKSSNNNEKFKLILASLYLSLKNDKTKAKKIYEEIYEKSDNIENVYSLVEMYNDANQMNKVKDLLLKEIEKRPKINFLRDHYISVLIDQNNYKEALKLVDTNLENFPYSFENFEQKATIYSLMNNKKEAEKYYKKALSHYSGKHSLRKKLYDLNNKIDEIVEVEVKDIYDFIKNKRNTTLQGDYGVTLLLKEFTVNVFPEGGRKAKSRYIYEITSENGIEELKEYSLNSHRVNLTKSEIVKKNGSIVPGEVGARAIVFSNLEVGDVIFIEYDYVSNSYGRFYKDFNLSFVINSSYPILESKFNLIHLPDLKFNTALKNTNLNAVVKKLNDKVVTQWHQSNIKGMPVYEQNSPYFDDLTSEIYLGTIPEWKDIANWYADLVKKNKKLDKVTLGVYNEIFPNGIEKLTETERAQKIYNYIQDNYTYSFMDFRQSGYVPQKPSKTIETKLGDCKDLSTLFVTLAEKAKLESNLVLVLTNNNGTSSLRLPSSDFNHCIVKIKLENKEYFIEMTNKYLPFKAMPMSLYNATALVIEFDKEKNENAKLINIKNNNALLNIKKSKTEITINEESKQFKLTNEYSGINKTYYNELFSNAISADIRKKEIEELYNRQLNKTIIYKNSELLSKDKFDPVVQFTVDFEVNEKLQSLGSLKIVEIPFFEKIYTKGLVSKETRNYPIDYTSYEDSQVYESQVILNIPEGKKFVEIPENKTMSYKNDTYEISYELESPSRLIVKRKAKLSWNEISIEEYSEFKKYVEEVILNEERIVGYK